MLVHTCYCMHVGTCVDVYIFMLACLCERVCAFMCVCILMHA